MCSFRFTIHAFARCYILDQLLDRLWNTLLNLIFYDQVRYRFVTANPCARLIDTSSIEHASRSLIASTLYVLATARWSGVPYEPISVRCGPSNLFTSAPSERKDGLNHLGVPALHGCVEQTCFGHLCCTILEKQIDRLNTASSSSMIETVPCPITVCKQNQHDPRSRQARDLGLHRAREDI